MSARNIQPKQSKRSHLLAEHQQVLPSRIWDLMVIRSAFAGCHEHSRLKAKHGTDRGRIFVKSVVCRKMKLINSDASFQTAIALAMDHESVSEELRGRFKMLYKRVFNEALNAKRSC